MPSRRGATATSTPVIADRALSRATLARQHLLARVEMPVLAMVDHLVGLQAQVPGDPYTALWSRIEGFDPAELSRLLLERAVVRLGVMRTTLHLVTADDALALRAHTQPVLERAWKGSPFAPHLDGLPIADVVADGRAFLELRPATTAQLARHLATRWPDRDPTSLAYALRFLEPIVQVPPRGTWGATHAATWTTVEAWLGQPVPPSTDEERIVLRYLAAFGPASVRDLQTWSWRTKMASVVDGLRPRLVTFRDTRGVELFDLPDAPRPDPDTPAPVRFLPEFDNVLLSHKDRSRFGMRVLSPDRAWHGNLLVDGRSGGVWRVVRRDGGTNLEVGCFADPGSDDGAAIEREAARLLDFLTDGRGGRIAIEVVAG
jgi:winged helix DNA-binding protein